MNINDITYLQNILGEEEARRCLKAEESRIKLLVQVLKKTSLKRELTPRTFQELCNKILYGKYGVVFSNLLCNIGKFPVGKPFPDTYRLLCAYYLKDGYRNEKIYREMFSPYMMIELRKKFPNMINDLLIEQLMEQEIAAANQEKITIGDFLKEGGSLEELVHVLKDNDLKDFNMNTKIPCLKLQSMKEEYYQVSISQITYLISRLASLQIGRKLTEELMEVYQQGMDQEKENGFATDTLVVKNKPKLYRYLNSRGYIATPLLPTKEQNHKKLSLISKKQES